MSWFKIISYETDLEAATPNIQYIVPPLKRKIPVSNLSESVETTEIVYCNLDNKIINKYYSSSNEELTDNDSYIVVYEDASNPNYFIPVKSKIIDNLLYFVPHEKIEKLTSGSRYYAVYYGMSNLKYIEPVEYNNTTIYQKVSQEDIDNAVDGDYYDLATANINNYEYEATSQSDKIYRLAFYNDGVDWVNNSSTKIGSKVFGIFDGPKIKIYGSKGSSFGKFRIRIFPYQENLTINNIPVVDWTTIDCYDGENFNFEILYEKLNLQYKKYIFEIETLAEKNIMSVSESVNIFQYTFIPNYKISCEKEQINPEIFFVTVSGIR